jgi:hypothetical protein
MALRHEIDAPWRLWRRRHQCLVAQFAILLHDPQMIESSGNEGLKTPAIKLQVLRGIDAGLLGFAQRLGTRSAQRDDEHFGPVGLKLIEQIHCIRRTQID